MKILLTGATGFLGSYLLKRLLKENHEIVVLKRSFSNTRRIEKELSRVIAYHSDECTLEQIFAEQNNIDAIIHTATCYGRAKEDAYKIHETNTDFPLKLLELGARYRVGRFVNTDTVLPRALNDYALSKKQFLEWGKRFAQTGKIQFVNMKLQHMYGPNDDDSKFVTYVIRQCQENAAVLNLTRGEQKRDFIYIDDVVEAYVALLAGNKVKDFQEYEVGTGKMIRICDLVRKIHGMTNSTTQLCFGAIPYRENEIMEAQADTRLLNMLGWKERVAVDVGLERCIESG